MSLLSLCASEVSPPFFFSAFFLFLLCGPGELARRIASVSAPLSANPQRDQLLFRLPRRTPIKISGINASDSVGDSGVVTV